ncbi:TAXI family TRAP transporter solute-binding subunit [Bacillus massiliigorillae]|uniref:TAXI family TRAP transporter solute-binding subunit n=1 Tax=Bacillus massiliigorillae TaxID=1243664 RepID=UPI0005AB3162|nr:TAXI family TRAP transporter solute-binding subunit [Bacillus massiliigorillae]
MRRKNTYIMTALFLIMSLLLAACSGDKDKSSDEKGTKEVKEEKKQFLNLVTGGTGGTYYPLGGSFAEIISSNTKAETTAQSSGASAENMEAIKSGDADLAFTQTDIASYATEGKLMFSKPITNVKAIASLYPETIQIVTTAKSGIKSIADLKGKSVSVGAPGSGTYANAEQILEVHGLTMKDIKAQNLSFDESTGGIQDGTIDAAFITAGTPTGAVESLAATSEVVILPIAEDKIKALIEKYPYYAEEVVPANTYKIKQDVNTVAVQAMLVVRADLDEQLVYDITKAIYEHLDKVTHAKGKLIKVENALNGVGIDVHPGAQKYFDEKGVKAK